MVAVPISTLQVSINELQLPLYRARKARSEARTRYSIIVGSEKKKTQKDANEAEDDSRRQYVAMECQSGTV